MLTWIAWLVAVVSAAAFIALWFWDVRRIMGNRKSTVESAAGQLESCRKRTVQAGGGPETEAVLERSRNIYRQAVEQYRQTLRKPWIWLPAVLMGFRTISPDEAENRFNSREGGTV